MRTIAKLAVFIFLVTSLPLAAITFGPERAASPPQYALPLGEQRPGAAATDGTSFMVFWADQTSRAGLYATHVSSSGDMNPLPQTPIRSGAIRSIAAVWTGSVYLVAWGDETIGGVMSATLSREGTVVSGPQIVPGGAVGSALSIAAGGSRALLTYLTFEGDARAALFEADGRLRRVGITLPIDAAPAAVKVASDGQRFGVVWSTRTSSSPLRYAYRFVRLSEEGERIDSSPTSVAEMGNATMLGLASGGGKWGFAVLERQLGETALVRRFRIDSTSQAVEALAAVETRGFNGGVFWAGSDFVAYWIRFGAASFDLLTLPFSESTPRTALHRDVPGTDPILVSNGTNVLAVWLDRPAVTEGGDVGAALLDRSAAAVEAGRGVMPVSIAAAFQDSVAIAAAPNEALIVWTERRGDTTNALLLGVRVGPDGTAIGAPLELAAASTGARADVAYTGEGYFVVWSNFPAPGGVQGRFVGLDGSLGETIRFGDGYSPAVAATRNVTLVVYDTERSEIELRRLTPRGSLIDVAPLPFAAARFGDFPRVASNGTDFLVVWSVGSDHWQFGTQDAIDVYAARVRENGSADAAPMAIATGAKNQSLPVVASDGRDYMVAYLLDYDPEKRLVVKRVLREGTLAEGVASDDGRDIGARGAVRAALAYVGEMYVAAWNTQTRDRRDVRLAKIDRTGARVGNVATIDGGTSVAVADAAGAGFLVAYARLALEQPYVSASRAFVRPATIEEPPVPPMPLRRRAAGR